MPQILNNEQVLNFPVQHLSYSSIKLYATSPQGFLRTYMRGEYGATGAAALSGSITHHAIDLMYRYIHGAEIPQVMADKVPDTHVFTPALAEAAFDEAVAHAVRKGEFERCDYGKTQDEASVCDTARRCLDYYLTAFGYEPTAICSELPYLGLPRDLQGNELPIPLKGKVDMVKLVGDDMVLVDFKTCASFTDPAGPVPAAYEVQAGIMWLGVRTALGVSPWPGAPKLPVKSPVYCDFYEIKRTPSRDGKQVQVIRVEYTPALIAACIELYTRVVRQLGTGSILDPITKMPQGLPGLGAQFGADEDWADFRQEVESGTVWNPAELRAARTKAYDEHPDM